MTEERERKGKKREREEETKCESPSFVRCSSAPLGLLKAFLHAGKKLRKAGRGNLVEQDRFWLFLLFFASLLLFIKRLFFSLPRTKYYVKVPS